MFSLPIIENQYIYNVNSAINDFPEKGSTVVVGMSGGVDSTLVTMLLKIMVAMS